MSHFSLIAILISCVCCVVLREVAAAPYQELEPKPGHVPVYIRVGDTPLSEIHPGLAEAFHEIDSANLKLESPTVAAKSTAADDAPSSPAPAVNLKESETKPEKTDAPLPPAEPAKETDIASFEKIKDERSNEAVNDAKE